MADRTDWLSKLERFRVYLAVGYLVTGIVVSLLSIAAIVYCIATGRWVPAIFILLARNEVVRWMDNESKRLSAPDPTR
jgi:hypothetical protein